MKLEYRKLSAAEITSELECTPKWASLDNLLFRKVEVENYLDGVVLASAIGFTGNKLDHHPKITIDYKVVEIEISTHAVGGISPYDFELARRIDLLMA